MTMSSRFTLLVLAPATVTAGLLFGGQNVPALRLVDPLTFAQGRPEHIPYDRGEPVGRQRHSGERR